MTDSKHTPGPWTLADENNQCCSVQLGTEHNLTANLDRQDGNTGKFVIERSEMLANARLIAAAPELLEALKNALWRMESYNYQAMEGTIANARAAIAKATGDKT